MFKVQLRALLRAAAEGDVRIMDYACAENNRNPVDPATGRTLTLGPDGKPIDADYRGD